MMPYSFLFAFIVWLKADHNIPTGKQQAPPPIAWTIGWSHNDRYIAVGNDQGMLMIYEYASGKKIKTFQTGQATFARVEWNPRYPILAIAATTHGKKSIVQLYDAAQNKILNTLPDTLYGRAVSWSPDGERVAYVGSRGRISIYHRTGRLEKTLSFTHPNSLFDIDWHPIQNLLLAVEEDIFIIDADKDRLVAKYDDGSIHKGILTCQWHPSGKFFVTGDYGHENEGGEPSFIRFWNKDGSLKKTVSVSKAEIRNTRWSPNGVYLAAAGNPLIILDSTGNLVSKSTPATHNTWGVSWNSTGTLVVSSDQASNIRITNVQGKTVRILK